MIGIKFCGGCHVSYNRKEVVMRIKEENEGLDFEYAREGRHYQDLLVVCKCHVKCAAVSPYQVERQIIYVDHYPSQEEFTKIKKLLHSNDYLSHKDTPKKIYFLS